MEASADREAESLYLAGAVRELFETMSSRANGDARTALALLQGCFLEMTVRLVEEEVVTARHGASLSSFLTMSSERLKELATAYGRGRLATSPQSEGAHLARTLRARFETSPATRRPHPSDDPEADHGYADHG